MATKNQDNSDVRIGIISKCMLALFIFILLHGVYDGIIRRPTELDSIFYHIPIARGILDGTVFHPTERHAVTQYFPGSSEAILSLFLLFRIPLNVYNVLSAAVFACSLYCLGRRNRLPSPLALIYAVGTAGLVGVTRWMDTQIIDVWMGVWVVLLICTLQRPKNSVPYAALTGALFGMVIGTKYSGLFYSAALALVFWKQVVRIVGNPGRFAVFILPLSCFGFFWYARNYIVVGNPIFPLSLFGLPGQKVYVYGVQTWQALLRYPKDMIVAIISEYGIWGTGFLFVPLYLRRFRQFPIYRIAVTLVAVFLILPSGVGYAFYVSTLRYAIPVLAVLILSVFVLMRERGWEKYISVVALAQLFFSVRVSYHPKLLFLFIPLALVVFFPELVPGKKRVRIFDTVRR